MKMPSIIPRQRLLVLLLAFFPPDTNFTQNNPRHQVVSTVRGIQRIQTREFSEFSAREGRGKTLITADGQIRSASTGTSEEERNLDGFAENFMEGEGETPSFLQTEELEEETSRVGVAARVEGDDPSKTAEKSNSTTEAKSSSTATKSDYMKSHNIKRLSL